MLSMMRRGTARAAAITALAAVLSLPRAAEACPGAGEACTLDMGDYLLLLPAEATPETPVPGLVYLHGWGASPAGFMKGRRKIAEALTAQGYALILPEGRARTGRTQRDWAVEDGGRHPRDDIAFLESIVEDAAGRGVDKRRLMLAGFSRGGSMVWSAACRKPGLFRAYAPVAGAFWEPLPERCAGPVDLFHVHGWDDKVVPLEGRPIGKRLMQGDIFAALSIMRRTMRCDLRQPDDRAVGENGRWTRRWTRCGEGGRLDLMLHPGGHVVPQGWIRQAIGWFEARLAEAAHPPSDAARRKVEVR